MPALLEALFAGALGTAALAQDAKPDRRAHHAMVFDESLGRVLLVGGSSPTADGESSRFFDDLWTFDGVKWDRVAETGAHRSDLGLAYDSRGKRVVSFGGFTGETLGDLRVLEGTKWRVIDETPALVLAGSAFAYDAARNRFVLLGGAAGDQIVGDMWEHDGVSWTKFAGPTPPARRSPAMVFDAKRARLVAFGGVVAAEPGSRPAELTDTWEFDGKAWKQIEVAGPSPRSGCGVAYDSKRGRMILFGGRGGGKFLADTWAFDGKTWRKLSDGGPEARGMGYLAYDKVRDRVVLFGGRKSWPDGDFADTWEFDGTTWREVAE